MSVDERPSIDEVQVEEDCEDFKQGLIDAAIREVEASSRLHAQIISTRDDYDSIIRRAKVIFRFGLLFIAVGLFVASLFIASTFSIRLACLLVLFIGSGIASVTIAINRKRFAVKLKRNCEAKLKDATLRLRSAKGNLKRLEKAERIRKICARDH